MNVDADSVKQWLGEISKDRHWLADEVGVSKRTLDNWFSEGFPLYAKKSIMRLRRELEFKPPELAETKISLTLPQWRELAKRAKSAGFEDEMEYVVAVLAKSLNVS